MNKRLLLAVAALTTGSPVPAQSTDPCPMVFKIMKDLRATNLRTYRGKAAQTDQYVSTVEFDGFAASYVLDKSYITGFEAQMSPTTQSALAVMTYERLVMQLNACLPPKGYTAKGDSLVADAEQPNHIRFINDTAADVGVVVLLHKEKGQYLVTLAILKQKPQR